MEKCKEGGSSVEDLRRHLDSLFAGNTEESTRMKLNDWSICCKILYKKAIVTLADAAWPPSYGRHFCYNQGLAQGPTRCFKGFLAMCVKWR